MEEFFEKENCENWSLASYLAKSNARTNEDFNKAKANYILKMLNLKNSKEYKGHKRLIGQLIKDAKNLKFEPENSIPTNINISGDVVSSIVGSTSSVLNINNNRKRRTLQDRAEQQSEQQQEQEQSIKRIKEDDNIFYQVDSEENIWDLWYQFFKECKADENMHEFR